MDFSTVELSAEDEAFRTEVREFLAGVVTEDVIRRDRETGDNFDEGVHLALGAAGYLEKEWKTEADGGFSRVRRRIWELEKRRAEVPWVTWGTTAMVARSVAKFASPEIRDDVLRGVFDGTVRLCLGYTEPEGGSDVATCKTRAVRDGDQWVINGSKMFTTGAHNCQYVFLITNTDPDAPKHKSLTMFLVPLDSEGIEIQGIRTSTVTARTSSTTPMCGWTTNTGSVTSTAAGRWCVNRSTPSTGRSLPLTTAWPMSRS